MGLISADAPRLVLIDWQLAAALPPTVDLAWMLLGCQPFACSREQVIDLYHTALLRRLGNRFDETTWEPQLRLALLGQAVRVMGYMLWQPITAPMLSIANGFAPTSHGGASKCAPARGTCNRTVNVVSAYRHRCEIGDLTYAGRTSRTPKYELFTMAGTDARSSLRAWTRSISSA